MSKPDEGHTFRFIFDIRGSGKVVGEDKYTDDKEFAQVYFSFDVRAWSLKEALAKAAEMPFDQLMNPIEVTIT